MRFSGLELQYTADDCHLAGINCPFHNNNMTHLKFSVAQSIFDRFPDYRRGVVVGVGVKNSTSSAELIDLLREAENAMRERWALESLLAHPSIVAWRDAFRKEGIKTSEYRPSVEALARRVLRSQSMPAINALVDVGNLVSLRHLVPVGAHAIDEISQDLWLRRADGTELFIPFGSDQEEHPAREEIVFAEGHQVLTRRWIWRQANRTLTLPDTRAIEFNIDALPPMGEAEVALVAAELTELIKRFCGGEIAFMLLSREHPTIHLPSVTAP